MSGGDHTRNLSLTRAQQRDRTRASQPQRQETNVANFHVKKNLSSGSQVVAASPILICGVCEPTDQTSQERLDIAGNGLGPCGCPRRPVVDSDIHRVRPLGATVGHHAILQCRTSRVLT
jgi:hypothetical protein